MSREVSDRAGSRWLGWRRVTRVVQPVIVLFLACHAATAQTTPPALAKGARVRVVIPAGIGQPERSVAGSLMSLDGDTVSIRANGTGVPVRFVLDGERRLEVAAVGRSHPLEGLAIGTGLGALLGAGIFAAVWTPHECTGFICIWPQDRREAVLYGAVIGVVPGTLLGLIAGLSTREVRWDRAETAGVRIAVAPRGIGLAIAF